MGSPIPKLVSVSTVVVPSIIAEWRERMKIRREKKTIRKTFGFVEKLWWRFMPGVTASVPWPTGMVAVDPQDEAYDWCAENAYQETFSADPNCHYRPWLEANVGRQGWDWNWRVSDIENNPLIIKFRRGKEQWATLAALKWS